MSLSYGTVVALLRNDDDVCCRDSIGGSISRVFVGGFAVEDGTSSLFIRTKSSITGCRCCCCCFGGEEWW